MEQAELDVTHMTQWRNTFLVRLHAAGDAAPIDLIVPHEMIDSVSADRMRPDDMSRLRWMVKTAMTPMGPRLEAPPDFLKHQWEHYKGDHYRIFSVARDEASGRCLVLYCKGDESLWARPLHPTPEGDGWLQMVRWGDGVWRHRFFPTEAYAIVKEWRA